MKHIKSKNILVACILSVFLIQINKSVYIQAAKTSSQNQQPKPAAQVAKPIVKPTVQIVRPAASIVKSVAPAAKPVALAAKSAARPTLQTPLPAPAAPSVTINIPVNLQDISLGSNNMFIGHADLIKALNNGETFTGTVASDRSLKLTSKTSSTTVTGTFWTKNQINYFCTGNKEYTYSSILNPGETVTIVGAKSIPSVLITSNLSDIYLFDTSRRDFSNRTDLINAINKGETFVGIINDKGSLTITNGTKSVTATSTCITQPNQIYYKVAGDLDFKNIPVTSGTTVTIVGVGQQRVIDVLKSNQKYDVYDIFMSVAPKNMKVGGISGSSVDISKYSYSVSSDVPCFNFFKSGCFDVNTSNGCSGASINDGLYIDDIQIKFPKPLNLGESDAIVIYIHVGPAVTLSHSVIPTASIGKIFLNGVKLESMKFSVNGSNDWKTFSSSISTLPLNLNFRIVKEELIEDNWHFTLQFNDKDFIVVTPVNPNDPFYLTIKINNTFVSRIFQPASFEPDCLFTIYQ